MELAKKEFSIIYVISFAGFCDYWGLVDGIEIGELVLSEIIAVENGG